MKNKEQLTVELLSNKFGGNISEAISFTEQFQLPFPEHISRPRLNRSATAAEARQYAIELEKYEVKKEAYTKEREEHMTQLRFINSILEEYIKKESGLLTIVPEQYQSKVYSKAYVDGHSGGFREIYNSLIDLIEIFE